ncbi:lactonase family protein [Algibacter sp. AS12]|uniref:lactonase family protein n=1 Tax=Algibacter sp. AS12 TaxID=3135773 RepID=UPI00398AE560
MNPKHLVILILPLILLNCKEENIPLYVGTYTSGDSEGIYKFDFNKETGELSNRHLAVATENPSFITYSPNKKVIYAVGEGQSSAVTAFKRNTDGSLSFINSESSQGKGPCHVNVNELGNKAVVSNYGGGTISIHSLSDSGSIEKAPQVFNHNEAGEKPAHAHSAQFRNDDLFVSDLGRNRLYHYKLNNDIYKLESESIVKIEGNPGPRHFSITKDGNFMYIINEYGGSITSVKKTDSGFEQIDHDSTLDENYKGPNKCADIHLSKDERFLYGSNRGENSIAVFKRDVNTGTINKIQNISVHGDWPRNFTIDPTGKFLLVANKKSNNIAIFNIDSATGKLSFYQDFKAPEPVCLLF